MLNTSKKTALAAVAALGAVALLGAGARHLREGVGLPLCREVMPAFVSKTLC